MPELFNRNPSNCPCALAIAAMSADGPNDARAVARNWMHDPHVSPGREKAFSHYARSHSVQCDTNNVRDIMSDYVLEWIRLESPGGAVPVPRLAVPDYLNHRLNHPNILRDVALGAVPMRLRGDYELVHLMRLNGLGRVFQWAKDNSASDVIIGPGTEKTAESSIGLWLDRNLDPHRVTEEQRNAFLSAVLSVVARYRRATRHRRPIWASSALLFEPFARAEANRWLDVCGMMVGDAPQWIIGLRYTAQEAGIVVRPCVLEGGWYQWFFPAPEDARYGHPMDLRADRDVLDLIPEFIHEPFDFTIDHWKASGCLCERTVPQPDRGVSAQRRTHRERLARHYTLPAAWMPDCA